jgi:hypothetical protein
MACGQCVRKCSERTKLSKKITPNEALHLFWKILPIKTVIIIKDYNKIAKLSGNVLKE